MCMRYNLVYHFTCTSSCEASECGYVDSTFRTLNNMIADHMGFICRTSSRFAHPPHSSVRACAHQKKFGEKMVGETESEKGHTCIPIEVHTQKARLVCVTAGSKTGQIVSRAGPAGSVIPEAKKYVKRKGNCNLVVTSYILKYHIPKNAANTYFHV